MSIKALISHSYIGTLLAACEAEGVQMIATQEAAGFGSGIQALNWPTVQNIPKRSDWLQAEQLPQDNKWFAIAQPPCAGGSMVTPGHARGGLENPKSAFHITHDFMKYAYSTRAPIIAVESVPGTLKLCGGDLFKMRDMYAPDYGVFVVLDNSSDYGCVSIRKRMWHIHYRKDLFPNGLEWTKPTPNRRTLAEALEGCSELPDNHIAPGQQKVYDKFAALFAELPQGHYANNWLRKAGRWDLLPEGTKIKVKSNGEQFIFYESLATKKLGFDQLAPTITGSTFLIHPTENRPLTSREYLRINNMPDRFRFPPSMPVSQHVTYIGKTVSIGIAKWVIQNMVANISRLD